MRPIATLSLLLLLASGLAAADEQPVDSPITSVGLFKNGLAVIQRTVEVPGGGVYRLDDVPTPVHGTFWIESDARVVTRLTSRLVETPADHLASDFQRELVGANVVVHFGENIPAVEGRVLSVEAGADEADWSRVYEQTRHNYGGFSPTRSPQQPTGRYLVLETASGRSYVDTSRMVHLEVADAPKTTKRREPVLLFNVDADRDEPALIAISYLTKGMAWAPSYRVDISDPEKLTIQQKAVIKNELGAIDDAEIRLISGFPSVQFSHVTSPLSLETTWATFFQQLNQRVQSGHAAISNAMGQQAISFNVAPSASGLDLSATPSGEGVDLHYQSIGRQTLDAGDSLSLNVASGQAAYDRIVEWIVPDTREANGRYIREHQLNEDPEKYRDAAWDAVRFKNPLDFPMTTAPAMIVADNRFNGQRMSYWVSPGEETTLHVTKALSVRTRSVEQEEEGGRSEVYIGGQCYRKVPVTGTLTVNNHRNETVALVIRRRFSGDLVEADRDPACNLLEEGVYSVNKRNQLVWALDLEPGKEITLTYRYTVLVYY